jgi:prepilin signal peptidase PulO-like enzyme (type II secretory pathway)
VALAAAGVPAWTQRFRRPGWVLVLPLSIAVVVAAIAVLPESADALTWVALILVPIGGGLALGWAMRGAKPALAVLAVPLLIVAWSMQDERSGELAALALIVGSAISAGRLIAGVAPLDLLKAGVILMAIVDAALVFSGNLEQPNDVLVAASPGAGLPQLQSASFNGAGLGYGDFFAAAVVGAIFAAERRPQFALAALLIAVSVAWQQLHHVHDVLPFTVPPALVLIAAEAFDLAGVSRARRRSAGSPRGSGAGPPAGARARSRARRDEPVAAPARRAS